jgi:hypothetical protein
MPAESHLQVGSLAGQEHGVVLGWQLHVGSVEAHAQAVAQPQPSHAISQVWPLGQSVLARQPLCTLGTQIPKQTGVGGHSMISQPHLPAESARQRPVGPDIVLPSSHSLLGMPSAGPHLAASQTGAGVGHVVISQAQFPVVEFARQRPVGPAIVLPSSHSLLSIPSCGPHLAGSQAGGSVGELGDNRHCDLSQRSVEEHCVSLVQVPWAGTQLQGPPQGSDPAQTISSPGLQLGKVQPQGLTTVGGAAPAFGSHGHW